ncbi:MAG: 30S ribosomal protein S1 [Aggregatilineales bacterium]
MSNITRIGKVSGVNGRKLSATSIEPDYTENVPPPPDEGYWAALLQEGDGSIGGVEVDEANRPFRLTGTNVSQDSTQHDWALAQQTYDADGTIDLQISGANRGGLLVEWNSLRGFVPASQLTDFPSITDPQARRAQLAARIGQSMTLRIIELDRIHNRLILSERAAQVGAGTRANVLDQLRRGDTISGQVTNVCDFGAFVDLGGLEGLIHISEISWGRVNHPRDLLDRGDVVAVYVMEVNRDQGRVALSLKRMQPDPWATVAERYHVGQTVTGQITNIVDFGAFVSIEEGLEGLIHVSELAEGHFLHPRNVVQEGEVVHARILNIDSQARRLGLSLREYVPGIERTDTASDYD